MMSEVFRRPLGPAVLRLATLALFFALPGWAQQPFVPAPHKPVAPPLPHPKSWHRPAAPRSMVGGFWMIDPDMKSSITLSNKVTSASVTVTPNLYLSNGARYTLPPVVLAPSGTAVIGINQALADQGIAPYAMLSGYVELDYSWPWDPICATIHNIDPAHSLLFNYTVPLATDSGGHSKDAAAAKPAANVLEGMWWKQEPNVSGFVALSNPTPQAINATVLVTESAGIVIGRHSVTVSPHGTKIVDLTEIGQTAFAAGGIEISYTGPPDGLLAAGGLEDKAAGYSANIPVGPQSPVSGSTSAASVAELGLMVGAADPMLRFPAGTTFTPYSVMRNVSGQPVTVTPVLYWMAGGAASSAQLSQLAIAPNQTRTLDAMSLLVQAGLKNFNGSVNLVLNVAGSSPHPLIMASGSVDQNNTYVFAVTPTVVAEHAGKALSYWSTGDGDDTMITLWNGADEAQELAFTLFYSGGQYKLPVHLGPRATQMFNISEIIENQVPDAAGNVIPASVHEGRAVVSGSRGRNEHILIAADAGTYNVKKATCGNYCVTCDGIVDAWIDADPFDVAMGGTNQLAYTVQDDFGDQYDATSYSSWRSSNTSIATVSGGLVTGVSLGSIVATGTDDEDQIYCHNCYFRPPTDCPCSGPVVVSSPGNTTPRIDSISPSTLPVGTTVPQITIAGAGFGTSPVVNLPLNVTSTGQQTSSDTQITLAGVVISMKAAIGFSSITVTVKASDGSSQTSNPGSIILDGPFNMSVLTDTLGTCSGCSNTVERDVFYQVMNFSGSNTATIKVGETPTLSAWNCSQKQPNFTSTPCSAGASTNSAGQFTDAWTLNSDSFTPAGCGFNVDDYWRWCPTGASIGHLSGYTHTNAVKINGVVSPPDQFKSGTIINP